MKTNRTILMSFLSLLTVTSVASFKKDEIKVNATGLSETFVQNAGQAAFKDSNNKLNLNFYKAMTTYTYRYFKDGENAVQLSHTSTSETKHLDDSKTVTVTEEQVLPYYLHIPFDYNDNPNKEYPVLVYCPGSTNTIFDQENGSYSTIVNFNEENTFTTGPFKDINKRYLQTVAYGKCGYGSGDSGNYISKTGEWLANDEFVGYRYWSYSNTGSYGVGCFLDYWYDLIINQGHTEYDCFIIYVLPVDEVWWENQQNMSCLNIHTCSQAVGIGNNCIYSPSQSYGYGSSYVASELSPAIPSQLSVSLIDEMMKTYRIDPTRQYIAGHSLGAQFSFDTIAHYPDRFAATIFTGLPASDVTEETCSKLVNTNIWTLNGNGDFCQPYFSTEFVKKMNSIKEKYNGTGTQQYSIFNGAGHCGQLLACNLPSTSGSDASGCGANCTQYSTDTLDFLFNSVRKDMNVDRYNNDLELQSKMVVDAKASTTLNNGTYDLGLIGVPPLGDYTDTGFILTPNDSSLSADKRSAKISCTDYAQTIKLNLNNVQSTIYATSYSSGSLFSKTITGISSDVTSFTLQSYATNSYGIIYGESKTYNVVINGSNVTLEEAN